MLLNGAHYILSKKILLRLADTVTVAKGKALLHTFYKVNTQSDETLPAFMLHALNTFPISPLASTILATSKSLAALRF